MIVDALTDRMRDLAADERFEEAAATRDRLEAFADAVDRQRALDRQRAVASLEVTTASGHRFRFRRGQLVRHWMPPEDAPDGTVTLGLDPGREVEAVPADPGAPESGPLAADLADELLLTARWLDRHAPTLRLDEVTGVWASPVRPIPRPGRVSPLTAIGEPDRYLPPRMAGASTT